MCCRTLAVPGLRDNVSAMVLVQHGKLARCVHAPCEFCMHDNNPHTVVLQTPVLRAQVERNSGHHARLLIGNARLRVDTRLAHYVQHDSPGHGIQS